MFTQFTSLYTVFAEDKQGVKREVYDAIGTKSYAVKKITEIDGIEQIALKNGSTIARSEVKVFGLYHSVCY